MRIAYLIGFLICAGLMGFALYAEHVLLLDPCPLCVFQRVAFIGMGVFFLIGALHNPSGWGSRVYAIIIGLFGLAGAAVAGRHIYIQNLPPDEVPDCGPGLEYMLETLPLRSVLEKVFTGSGECAEVVWSFLGISMPGWTLVWFILLTLLAFGAGWKSTRRQIFRD